MKGPELINMYVGQSEENVREGEWGVGAGLLAPEPPLPSGCSWSLLVFLSPGQVPAGWGLLPEVLVMNCQHGFPSPSPDFKSPWASPSCGPFSLLSVCQGQGRSSMHHLL